MKEGSLEAPTRHPIDWQNPAFYDEAALDKEMRHVLDICHGCRRCVSLCTAFPTLFDLIDEGETGELESVDRKDFAKVVGEATNTQGVDVILDMVGGSYVPREMKSLREEGRLVFIAMLGGAKAELDIAEVMRNLDHPEARDVVRNAIGRLLPSAADLRRCIGPILRGTGLGAVIGIFPGTGPFLATFASYALEKKIAKDPSRFGRGAIEGVAGPESANNAGSQTSFIPMLTLGIPSNAIMALMVGAMTIQGIAPGPRVMTNQPDLFWGVIVSMWVGNAMLLVINLPLIGIWVQLLKVPYRMLFPCIVLICAIGGFSLNNSTYEIGMVGVFAVLGYFMRKVGCEPAPLALGFILGPLMEENLRRAMLLSRGDPLVFVQRPISASLLALTAALIFIMVLPNFRSTREVAFQED